MYCDIHRWPPGSSPLSTSAESVLPPVSQQEQERTTQQKCVFFAAEKDSLQDPEKKSIRFAV